MNFQQAQERVEALIKLGSWSNAVPGPDYSELVQWGINEFLRSTEDNQESISISTVAGQAEYKMTTEEDPRKWWDWNDDALWQWSASAPGQGSYLPQSTRQKIRQDNDVQYLDTPPAVPFYWYKAQDQVIGLWPAPATSGTIIRFSGSRNLAPLQEADEEIPWMDRYAEACCLLGAVYYGKTQARGEELRTLARYKSEAEDLMNEFLQDTINKEASLFNRRVQRPRQDYVSCGTRFPFAWPSTNTYNGPGNG